MSLEQRAVVPLKVFLVLLHGILLVCQVLFLPVVLGELAEQWPDDAHLRWPLTAVAAVEILCVQVALVATWKLLDLVEADLIFRGTAFRWVDTIVRAIGAAWVVLGVATLAVAFSTSRPGLPLLMLLLATGVTVLGLLMLVMRALLRQATALRSDLEAVI